MINVLFDRIVYSNTVGLIDSQANIETSVVV